MITVVTGMARSGTSLTMQMLDAAGIPVFCAEESYGYGYECDEATGLPREYQWLRWCEGKAVKILDPQQFTPPVGFKYRFILLERNPTEQAKSQLKFLRALGWNVEPPTDRRKVKQLARSIERDKYRVRELCQQRGNVLLAQFEELITRPLTTAYALCKFLELAPEKIRPMVDLVELRTTKCLDYLREAEITRGEAHEHTE